MTVAMRAPPGTGTWVNITVIGDHRSVDDQASVPVGIRPPQILVCGRHGLPAT
jgi:hypothetical protein